MDIFRLQQAVDIDELLHQDHYTPEELAILLDVSPSFIRHEAWVGNLRAFIVDHRVADIRRQDVLDWLRERRLI